MTALPSYSTGTVSVAADGTTVTAAGGANWTGQNALPGDLLQIGEFQTIVSDFPTGTSATIPPWGGGTQTAQPYTLFKTSPQRITGQPAAQAISDLVTVLNGMGTIYAVAGDAPDPSIGNDGQYALKTNTGIWKLWLKSGGAWVLQGTPVGANYRGIWSGATAYAVSDTVSRNGSSYISKSPNTNLAPESNPGTWDILAAKGETGNVGAMGPTGNGATIAVNSTTTLPAGSNATVTNIGTTSDASLVFAIPRGETGAQGTVGPQGQGIDYDASGTLAQRATHDGEAIGYSYLQTDVSPFRLFVKASNSSGDWAGPTFIGGNFPVGDMGPITDTIVQTYEFGSIA